MPAMPTLARRTALIALAALCIPLAGCQTSGGKKIEYKSVSDAPPLEIPPDLTTPRFDDRYSVNTASALAQQDATRPHGVELLPKNPDAHIARAGNERWLVVKATPEQAWAQVHQFWIEQGFVIATEQPAVGIMETDWAENRSSVPDDFFHKYVGKYLDVFGASYTRDKFRSRIERGSEPGTVEIYISHRGMEEVPTTKIDNSSPAGFQWAPTAGSPEVEAEMLAKLMERFGASEPQAVAAIAQSTAQADQAHIEKAKNGSSQLVVNDTFDRAWRRVGLALDRTGFTVVDRDRSKGLYYVRYANPEIDMAKKDRDSGFLSKLMFWRKDDKDKPEQYRVLVAEVAPRSIVSVQDANGTPDRTEIGDKILGLLKDQLK